MKARTPYVETFDDGPGGWVADASTPLPVWDGVAYCHGPWFVDANHAPPGAGYLHMLMYLHTKEQHLYIPIEKDNRFVRENHSRDLRNARLSVRMRGRLEGRGAQVLIHIQGEGPNGGFPRPNFALTGQPLRVTEDWSEQTITLTPDPAQWTYMGARHDMQERYGAEPDLPGLLSDVSCDIIFILFPLTIVPMVEVEDKHRQYAGRDYSVDPKSLPHGLIMFDTVRIDYPK